MTATIRSHDQPIQTLRLRIAKLKKQAFSKSSEKVEREIEQFELALEDLLIAAAESVTAPWTRMWQMMPAKIPLSASPAVVPACQRPLRASGASLIRAAAARIAAATCGSWAKT